jgi:hypothetical protein
MRSRAPINAEIESTGQITRSAGPPWDRLPLHGERGCNSRESRPQSERRERTGRLADRWGLRRTASSRLVASEETPPLNQWWPCTPFLPKQNQRAVVIPLQNPNRSRRCTCGHLTALDSGSRLPLNVVPFSPHPRIEIPIGAPATPTLLFRSWWGTGPARGWPAARTEKHRPTSRPPSQNAPER